MKFEDLAPKVLRDLKDENSAFWSVDEINEYIDEGQLRYCEESGYLRRVTPITNKENREVYTFPEDMIRLLRAENSEGSKLTLTDSQRLQNQFGDLRPYHRQSAGDFGSFRKGVGTPQYMYSDLDGKHQFRLYPRPEPSIEDGGNPVANTIIQELDIHMISQGQISITKLDDILYVATTTEVALYDETFTKVKSYPHGLTVGNETLKLSVAKPVFTGGLEFGVMVLGHDDKLYTIDPGTGVVTLFGTMANSFGTAPVVGLHTALAKNLYYDDGSDFRAIDMTAAFSEVLIKASINVLDSDFGVDANVLLVCETGGIYEINGPDGSLPRTMTLTNATSISGVAFIGTTIYVNDSGTLSKYTLVTGVIVATSITTLLSSSRLLADGPILWAINSDSKLIKIINDTIVETYSDTTASVLEVNRSIALNKQLINGSFYSDSFSGLNTTDNELGGLVYSDGDTFDQDQGIVIDSIDPDNTVTIEGEEGAIVSNFVATDQGTLFYTREPVPGLLEISDHQALIEFAKYRALEKTGDREGLPKASYFLTKFNNRLSKAKGFAARGSNNNPRGVSAQYY